jgi:hypothetical protein
MRTHIFWRKCSCMRCWKRCRCFIRDINLKNAVLWGVIWYNKASPGNVLFWNSCDFHTGVIKLEGHILCWIWWWCSIWDWFKQVCPAEFCLAVETSLIVCELKNFCYYFPEGLFGSCFYFCLSFWLLFRCDKRIPLCLWRRGTFLKGLFLSLKRQIEMCRVKNVLRQIVILALFL